MQYTKIKLFFALLLFILVASHLIETLSFEEKTVRIEGELKKMFVKKEVRKRKYRNDTLSYLVMDLNPTYRLYLYSGSFPIDSIQNQAVLGSSIRTQITTTSYKRGNHNPNWVQVNHKVYKRKENPSHPKFLYLLLFVVMGYVGYLGYSLRKTKSKHV